jgi:hypothetical protein
MQSRYNTLVDELYIDMRRAIIIRYRRRDLVDVDTTMSKQNIVMEMMRVDRVEDIVTGSTNQVRRGNALGWGWEFVGYCYREY